MTSASTDFSNPNTNPGLTLSGRGGYCAFLTATNREVLGSVLLGAFCGGHMQRRAFITLLGGAAVAWPRESYAQQKPTPVIAILSAAAPDEVLAKSIRKGLAEAGYEAGRNLAIEYRYADGKYDQLPNLVADLTAQPISLIVALPAPAALAAKNATATIPIVFMTGLDAVKAGLVESYSKPGGNLTGVSMPTTEMIEKRIELLHELLPEQVAIAELVNPSNPASTEELNNSERAARAHGREFFAMRASSKKEIEAAFETVREKKAALVVAQEGFFTSERSLIVSQAASHGVISIYGSRIFSDAGGLISYGPDFLEAWRLVGTYAGKILNGAKPHELPVVQPVKYELVINLKAAKSLGLNIPPALLARADEVIE